MSLEERLRIPVANLVETVPVALIPLPDVALTVALAEVPFPETDAICALPVRPAG